jgi:hypothetical protein
LVAARRSEAAFGVSWASWLRFVVKKGIANDHRSRLNGVPCRQR